MLNILLRLSATLLVAFSCIYGHASCDSASPFIDASKRVDQGKREFIAQTKRLTADNFDDLILIDKDSCNSKGCVNFIYTAIKKNECYDFSGRFFGFLTVKSTNRKMLKLHLKQGLNIRALQYNMKSKMFE